MTTKTNLIILTSEPPFYGNVVIQKLLCDEITNRYNISIYTHNEKRQILNFIKAIIRQIIKSGLKYVLHKIIFFLKYKNMNRKNPRNYGLLKDLRQHPCVKLKSFSEFDELPIIGSSILISIYFDKKIPETILNKCDNRINLHPSAIPDYKGISPVFWVLANNERETGYTFHKLEKEIDSGDILYQEIVPIFINDTFHSLYLRLSEKSSEVLKTYLVKDRFPEQNRISDRKSRYFSYPTKASYREFLIKHKKFI